MRLADTMASKASSELSAADRLSELKSPNRLCIRYGARADSWALSPAQSGVVDRSQEPSAALVDQKARSITPPTEAFAERAYPGQIPCQPPQRLRPAVAIWAIFRPLGSIGQFCGSLRSRGSVGSFSPIAPRTEPRTAGATLLPGAQPGATAPGTSDKPRCLKKAIGKPNAKSSPITAGRPAKFSISHEVSSVLVNPLNARSSAIDVQMCFFWSSGRALPDQSTATKRSGVFIRRALDPRRCPEPSATPPARPTVEESDRSR